MNLVFIVYGRWVGVLSPNIFSLPFPVDKSLHFYQSSIIFQNIPHKDSDLNLLIKASSGVSPISRFKAPWILLLYQFLNSSDVENLFLCFMYS